MLRSAGISGSKVVLHPISSSTGHVSDGGLHFNSYLPYHPHYSTLRDSTTTSIHTTITTATTIITPLLSNNDKPNQDNHEIRQR